MNTVHRLARPGDERAIESFLALHADSSLYLRSFLARGWIADEGNPLQGTYAVAFLDDAVIGAAMFNWQGGIFLQAPDHADVLARLVVTAVNRPLVGLLGPPAQVDAAYDALGRPAAVKRSTEGLYALTIAKRLEPCATAETHVCRLAESQDLAVLREWRFGYEQESTGMPANEETRAFAVAAIDGHVMRGEAFVLEVDGKPAAMATVNARAAESVQIGGVYTPPALRGRSYGCRVVAGALDWCQGSGASRAILFTDNPAAERSYAALGFQRVGDYAVLIVSSSS